MPTGPTARAAGRAEAPEPQGVSRTELPAANPVVAWYYRYREGSALRARDWERFSDPRRTTYRAYTVLQDSREDVVDGLLREVDGEPRIDAVWEVIRGLLRSIDR